VALYFLIMIGLSISAYAIIWNKYHLISVYSLCSIFQNTFHFGSIILKVIPFFKNIIKLSEINPDSQII